MFPLDCGRKAKRLIWSLWLPALQVVTAVIWNKPDSPFPVPVWIIILAVLSGLLLLALLIYLLYKVTRRWTRLKGGLLVSLRGHSAI